ncbi:hypothetical protein AR457_41925 (plasmid) [Streptomyces agglomeratus]|nr:hypothetical protein AR457_41925 [Streptomyces agglomeratus]
MDAGATAFHATVVASPAPDATAAQREQFLVERVIWLQEEAGRLKESVDKESRERREAVRRLGGVVQDEANQLGRIIKSAMADGLAQEAMGLGLAAFGTLLVTIAAVL